MKEKLALLSALTLLTLGVDDCSGEEQPRPTSKGIIVTVGPEETPTWLEQLKIDCLARLAYIYCYDPDCLVIGCSDNPPAGGMSQEMIEAIDYIIEP